MKSFSFVPKLNFPVQYQYVVSTSNTTLTLHFTTVVNS